MPEPNVLSRKGKEGPAIHRRVTAHTHRAATAVVVSAVTLTWTNAAAEATPSVTALVRSNFVGNHGRLIFSI